MQNKYVEIKVQKVSKKKLYFKIDFLEKWAALELRWW